MRNSILIDANYFREYRQILGFSNQNTAKCFLAGKDISPNIDWLYITEFNNRLFEIVKRLNKVVDKSIVQHDIEKFKERYILEPYNILKANNMIGRLNNQGRRPEQVYFSWMRGYVITQYFLQALEEIFSVQMEGVEIIGDDDLRDIETFKRTPKADLEVSTRIGEKLRLEIQAGFTGINDIKQHKVLEAKKLRFNSDIGTMLIHFDIYNGQVAFVKIDSIEDSDANWVTRQQMEGQTVLSIDQNFFLWKLIERPLKYETIVTMLN